MSKLAFSEYVYSLFDEQLSEMIIDFCVLEETELVDFERVSWLGEIIVYIPRIISKDKNLSQLDYVFKGEDKFKIWRENCNKRVEKLIDLIQYAIRTRFNMVQRAFKFFDSEQRMRIKFNHFIDALDLLDLRI